MVRAVKVFMMARVVQMAQTVPIVPLVQVIRLIRVVQVIRRLGGQVVRVVMVASLDENVWFSCPKLSNNCEKLRCHGQWKVEQYSV